MEVERNISLYPELKEELKQIELTQEKLLFTLTVEPPASVKEKIMQRAFMKTETRVVEMKPRALWWRYSLAASVILTLVSSFLAYRYYFKWREADSSLTELLAQNQR